MTPRFSAQKLQGWSGLSLRCGSLQRGREVGNREFTFGQVTFEVTTDTQWRCQISSWIYGLKFRGEVGATDVIWELSAYTI